MKKVIAFLVAIFIYADATAQSTSKDTASSTTTGVINGLSIPSSPAFSITDITPTLVSNPSTPRAFALGIAQSSAKAGTLFPNNYSAEFAPVWWIDPKGISIYSYLGVPKTGVIKENIFAGLRFTTLSVAFVNKNLIPDTTKAAQNIFSIGAHTTLIRVFGNEHARKLDTAIRKWHADALKELDANALLIDALSRLNPNDTDYQTKVNALQKEYKEINTPNDFKAINNLIAQKPAFSWDISAAVAEYGVSSHTTEIGRAGVWTSLATNLPIGKIDNGNYFTINALGRYLYDRYQLSDQNIIGKANNIDVGGNLGFELNRLNVAVESLYRFTNGVSDTENRTVGIISVKLTDNIYVNGTFGKDFAGPDKLISLFGINWGFGKEKVTLPDLSK